MGLIWLVKGLVDEVFTGRHFDRLPYYLAAYSAITIAKIVIDNVWGRIDVAVTEQITLDVRTAVYRRLISVSPASISQFNVGALLSHLGGDAGRIEFLINSGPRGVFSSLISAVVYTVTLVALSPVLTLCAFFVAPLLALAAERFSRRMRQIGRINRRRSSAWMGLAEERLGSTSLIQLYTSEAAEEERLRARLAAARDSELRTVRIQNRMSTITGLIGLAGGLLVMAVGAEQIRAGALSVGGLIAFLGSVGSLYSPIRSLAKQRSRFERSAASAERIVQLLDLPSVVEERPHARPLRAGRGAVEFRDVSFGYHPDRPVLDHMSLRIEPGETVAIVGPSGAGKSTLARLLVRLHDATSGAILVDGEDVRDVTLSSLRKVVCVVMQEPHLFRGSVAELARYGSPDAPREQVADALKAAHAQGFVQSLDHEILSVLGPRGGGLSGGQQQRLAIARGLLRDAPILFLDEATSAVDSEAEELIHEAIRARRGDRTLIVVSHRLSSVRQADRLVLLEHGRIVETGAPETLMASSSRFGELFAAQLV